VSETQNIARMAEKLSEEVLGVFGWKIVGGLNRNWTCVEPERHDSRKHHPTDVVFGYVDPYSPNTVLVNTDLKAYASGSITKERIGDAISSMAQAAECLEVSQEWQDAYAKSYPNWRGVGLVFVHNTDGSYDGAKFADLLDSLDETTRTLKDGCLVWVMGPAEVDYLWLVATDIDKYRARHSATVRFFHHQRVTQRVGQEFSQSASIESLMGPWQIIQVVAPKDRRPDGVEHHYVVFYRGPGRTVDEFVYLIDVLFRLELFRDDHVRVDLRLVQAAANAPETWTHAVEVYLSKNLNMPATRTQLEAVKVGSITHTRPKFSETEIGLERR
jgi:hypothetical protein